MYYKSGKIEHALLQCTGLSINFIIYVIIVSFWQKFPLSEKGNITGGLSCLFAVRDRNQFSKE